MNPSKPVVVQQPTLAERMAALTQRFIRLETELYTLKDAFYAHSHEEADEPEAEPEIELEREARE